VDCSELLDILNSGTSIKVLLQIDDLTAGTAAPGGLLSWTARLGNMAITLANGYVMQAPVSRLSALQSGLQEGLEFEGPALFSIYIGNSGQRSGLPVYLDAAATAESRVFPVFNYNPARGGSLRDRLDILAQEIRQSRVSRTETEPVRNDSSRCVAGNPIAWAAARVEFRHGLDEARSFSRKG